MTLVEDVALVSVAVAELPSIEMNEAPLIVTAATTNFNMVISLLTEDVWVVEIVLR